MKDPIMKLGAQSKVVAAGLLETPNITMNSIPDTMNPGDKITPGVTVKRADGVTAIPGMEVTFFAEDSHGTLILGTTQTTDASGNATADESYFVADTEAGNNVTFDVVTWPKVV